MSQDEIAEDVQQRLSLESEDQARERRRQQAEQMRKEAADFNAVWINLLAKVLANFCMVLQFFPVVRIHIASHEGNQQNEYGLDEDVYERDPHQPFL